MNEQTNEQMNLVDDDELCWTPHIETVSQKLNRLVEICYKLSHKLPDWCLCGDLLATGNPCADRRTDRLARP